jgi:hypothetical protein
MSIANYQRIKTIFDLIVVVNIKDLLFSCNLIAAIKHLANNKANGTKHHC